MGICTPSAFIWHTMAFPLQLHKDVTAFTLCSGESNNTLTQKHHTLSRNSWSLQGLSVQETITSEPGNCFQQKRTLTIASLAQPIPRCDLIWFNRSYVTRNTHTAAVFGVASHLWHPEAGAPDKEVWNSIGLQGDQISFACSRWKTKFKVLHKGSYGIARHLAKDSSGPDAAPWKKVALIMTRSLSGWEGCRELLAKGLKLHLTPDRHDQWK